MDDLWRCGRDGHPADRLPNFTYGGWLVQRTREKADTRAELFSHGAEGFEPHRHNGTMLDWADTIILEIRDFSCSIATGIRWQTVGNLRVAGCTGLGEIQKAIEQGEELLGQLRPAYSSGQ